jgi:hypothetical protein
MQQPTLTTPTTASLRRNATQNFKGGLYGIDTSWVEQIYEQAKPVVDSNVSIDQQPVLRMPEGTKLYDLENSIALFSAYRNLTFHQAASENLWSYMTHIQYWAYMRRRWPVANSDNNQEEYIKEHYFLKNTTDRSLIRNGIARLWWYAKLTYEEGAEQPFRLTGILLSQLDITQGLLERSWGRNRNVLHGYLEFLAANPELMKGNDANRIRTRYLYKSLTLEGGINILDVRSKEEVAEFLEGRYKAYEQQRKA